MRSSPLRVTAIVVIVALLSILAPSGATACNYTYCSFRGNGTNSTYGTDGCYCSCDFPYFGYRCLYEYVSGASPVINCGVGNISTDAAACNATTQCYWNESTSTCSSKILPPYSADQPTPISLTVPWCYRWISLPLQIVVYSFAAAAFGVGGVGLYYMLRYRNTYSVVNENGERTFNQFYSNPWPTLIYCAALFLSAALLAITAYINFRDPTICVFTVFFFMYIGVQGLAIVWPCIWMYQFFEMRYKEPEKKMCNLDEKTKPIKRECHSDPKSCQVRCF